MMIKLGLQGVKFAYITRKYLGNTDSFLKLVGVRVGSEFIKFTTPMFIGAEFVVIYYLKKKGIELSKATWIALVDIVTEVSCSRFIVYVGRNNCIIEWSICCRNSNFSY